MSAGGLRRLGLIAGREFGAYVATASFWVALCVGPAAMGGALWVGSAGAPRPAAVAVVADDAGLARAAANALARAAALEGRRLAIVADRRAPSRLTVRRSAGGLALRFDGAAPLSPEGRALATAQIERDDALSRLGRAPPDPAEAPAVKPAPAPGAAAAASRFALVLMLWLTLTGSLGMLLQAVVRERANRALESLLAAARPGEIVFGKLAGIGAVSLLVLAAWLGSGALMSGWAPVTGGILSAILRTLGQPALLARAIGLYALAYLLFGLVTITVGAAAPDVAGAQNLSRPMFAVLLAVFFCALAAAGGTHPALAWLIYLPPFAPFMLLLAEPGALAQAASLALVIAAILGSAGVAVRTLGLRPGFGNLLAGWDGGVRAIITRPRARTAIGTRG